MSQPLVAQFEGRLARSRKSVIFRTIVITIKLLAVYVLSLKDAAFFYQQF